MATAGRVSIEEYLRTSYRPDVEYIDGELKQKPVVGFAHEETQGFIFKWFSDHYQEWNIRCAVETRTRVSPERVRLPDVVVVAAQDRRKTELNRPPIIALEVLFPSDSYQDLKRRAADLENMGVRNVWLIDEDVRTVEIWKNGAWELAKTTKLRAVESPMYLDMDWVWRQLDQ